MKWFTLLGAVTMLCLYESLSRVSVNLQRRKTLIFTALSCSLRSSAESAPASSMEGRDTDRPLTTNTGEQGDASKVSLLIYTIYCTLTEGRGSNLSLEKWPCLSSSNVSSFTAMSRVRQCLKSWRVKTWSTVSMKRDFPQGINAIRSERYNCVTYCSTL